VLRWVFERTAGRIGAVDTPVGRVPASDDLDTDGLEVDDATVEELFRIDPEVWRREVELIDEHLDRFGDRLPTALRAELDALAERLGAAG